MGYDSEDVLAPNPYHFPAPMKLFRLDRVEKLDVKFDFNIYTDRGKLAEVILLSEPNQYLLRM